MRCTASPPPTWPPAAPAPPGTRPSTLSRSPTCSWRYAGSSSPPNICQVRWSTPLQQKSSRCSVPGPPPQHEPRKSRNVVTVGYTPMNGDTNISAIASVLADPGRCRVLAALGDGRALPASMLAAEAGVAPSTASEHLSKLVRAGLLTVERHSRHRYFRLAGPDVADLLEALARVAPPSPVRSLREGTRAHALRSARTCYDHLAG